jgi:hypothetical protein
MWRELIAWENLIKSHDVHLLFEIKVQECLVHYIPTLQ